MIIQDYIMRLIQQLVKFLAVILFKKEAKNYIEAIGDIEKSFGTFTGLDYDLLKDLSPADIIRLIKLSGDDNTENIKFVIAAKLLKERTDLKYLINNYDSDLNYEYERALELFLTGILNNKNKDIDLKIFYQDIHDIIKYLKNYDISSHIRKMLEEFYKLPG